MKKANTHKNKTIIKSTNDNDNSSNMKSNMSSNMNIMKFSKNQNENNYHGKIDLHGYTKSEAISKLTLYMEQQVTMHNNNNNKRHTTRKSNSNSKQDHIWILVITGSGAHSNQGPVLRDAIQSLFDKRQIQYKLNYGRGSFTVNINSGYKLYGPDLQETDTKVVVLPQEDGLTIPQQRKSRSNNNTTAGWNRRIPPPTSDYDPTLSEIAANQKQFQESKKLHENEMKLNAKEGRLLKKALSMSLLEVESSEAVKQQQEEQEEDMLKRAMSLSMLDDCSQQQYNYDDDLLKAMELSKKEAAATDEDGSDDYDLEKVLAISIQQQKQKQDNNKTTSTTEDEIEFQRILEQSKSDF